MATYLYLDDLFTNLIGRLTTELITNFNPNPLVENIITFSGSPVEAIRMHFGDAREGSRNILLIGYSPETIFEAAGSGEPITTHVPVSLIVIRSFEGRAGLPADFIALNKIHDAIQRAMTHQIITPNELGVFGYGLLSAADVGNEVGGWGGRRLIYGMIRDAEVTTAVIVSAANIQFSKIINISTVQDIILVTN